MNKSGYILKHKQGIGICFGIIAAIVILISQSFYYDYLASADSAVTVSSSDDDETEHDVVTISKDAVTTAVQPIIIHALHFIADIYSDGTPKIEVAVDQQLNFNTYFKTLFRLIISPNAP